MGIRRRRVLSGEFSRLELSIQKIGETVLGQSIDCWRFSTANSKERILIVGGVHGDEFEGIQIAHDLIKLLYATEIILNEIFIIPCLNKDGEVFSLRSNYRDVDLNRNLPTKNWISSFTNPRYKPGPFASSEPETKAFLDVLNTLQPTLIISLHSFSESLILYNPAHGQFDEKISKLSQAIGIKIVDKMNYEVLGSLNTLCREKSIPVITIEAPRDDSWIEKRELFVKSLQDLILDT